MRKILVCQHVPHEILGTLNPLFKKSGFRIRYVNFGRHPLDQPSLEGYEGLVILGGPMSVEEVEKHPHLNHEMQLIRDAIKMDIPVLGICLGSQLIAKTLGARVGRNPVKEIGWLDIDVTEEGKKDPLMVHFQAPEKLFQWHEDAFELPPGSVHLASSPTCTYQAFRYGDKVYGFQFHLEVDEPMIERWLRIALHKREIEDLNGHAIAERIRSDTLRYVGRLMQLSALTFGEFIKLFGIEKKYRRLSSR